MSPARSLVFLAALALVACACPPSYPHGRDVLGDELSRTAEVDVVCGDDTVQAGTAVAVGGRAYLTALHVVNCSPTTVFVSPLDSSGALPGGKTGADLLGYEATVDGITAVDIARLSVPDLPDPFAPVRVGDVELGDSACAVVALPVPGRRCGDVQPELKNDAAAQLQVALVAEHGNSGAGIWTADGRLAGILTRLRLCDGGDDDPNAAPRSCGAEGARLWDRSWLASP